MSASVKDTRAMLSDMAPLLDPATYYFCIGDDTLLPRAVASVREEEGLSLVLDEAVAREHGLANDLPMRRITLRVHSALDGIGLTAAVSGVLADAGIACNMVAGLHHDHAFVPTSDAERAVGLLSALAERYA